MREVVIATRQSALAMWQALHVKARLEAIRPDWQVKLLGMTTKGDILLDSPLSKIGGKGLFVKELEVAMQAGEADLAVHSMKDVPMALPEGFGLAAILSRENPCDAFVSNDYARLEDLPHGAVLGTSSLRRQCQLLQLRPDLQIQSLRGNVQTRLSKLDQGQYAAIVLASAGLLRLELPERIRYSFATEQLLPACGQGAIGIETRLQDEVLNAAMAELNHADTAACVLAERAMNRALNGGCQVPIAGFCTLDNKQLSLQGRVGAADGSQMLVAEASAGVAQAEALGEQVAEALLEQGAAALLDLAAQQ